MPPKTGSLRLPILLAALLLVLAACDNESAGPEEGVTTADLAQLEERLQVLEERIAVLETDPGPLEEEDIATPQEDFVTIFDEILVGPTGEQEVVDIADLIGSEVTVSAEVSRVLEDNAFTIGQELTAGRTGVLVLSQAPHGLEEGELVQIDGTVEIYEAARLQPELAAELEDEQLVEFERQVALVASSIETGEE